MTTETLELGTATAAPVLQKWTAGADLGPRMLAQFNEALKAVGWAARGVQELTGIVEKPETHKKGMVFVVMFGGAQHPEYSAKLAAIQETFGSEITKANYKDVISRLEVAKDWFNQNPMIKDLRITQEAHDKKEAEYAQARAERDRKDEEHAASKRIIVGELMAKYPWAVGRRASENLKTLLGQSFPGILFSVRSDSNSLTVSWDNGPTENEVGAIAGQFRSGHFDGQTECYEYDRSAAREAWTSVMGSVHYVSYSRAVDRQPVIDALAKHSEGWDEHGHHSVSQVAYRLIAKTSFPAGATITGVERLPDVSAGQMEDWYQIIYTKSEVFQAQAPVVSASGITVKLNKEKGGVEIYFPAKPEQSVIDRCKSAGFRWSRFSSCWWAKDRPSARAFAYGLTGETVPTTPTSQPSESLRDPGEDAADRWAESQTGLQCNA